MRLLFIVVALCTLGACLAHHNWYGRGSRYYNRKKIYRPNIATCPVKMDQRAPRRRRITGLDYSIPQTTNKINIVIEEKTPAGFTRNNGRREFLHVFEKEINIPRMRTHRVILDAMEFYRDNFDLDFLSLGHTPQELLDRGEICAFDNSACLFLTTFSSARDGEKAQLTASAEFGNRFCRAFKKRRVSFSGIYIRIVKDLTTTNGNNYTAPDTLFFGYFFIPGCEIAVEAKLVRLTFANGLETGLMNISTNYNQLGDGILKYVLTSGNGTAGYYILEWEDPPRN